MASAICSIISSRLSLLLRIKPYFNFDSSLRFNNSCVNSYFTYCSAAWGNWSTIFVYFLIRKTTVDLRFLSYEIQGSCAPKCFKNRFQLLLVSRGPLGHLTRAFLYDLLKVSYPHSNSRKRTFTYSFSTLFNDLNSDLKGYFSSSSLRTSKSLNFILSFIKCKLPLLHIWTFSVRFTYLRSCYAL